MRLDQEDKVELKIYGVTNRETNYYDTHIAQYFEKQMQSRQ